MEKIYSRVAIIAFLAIVIFAWLVDCIELPKLSAGKIIRPAVKHVIIK